MTDLPSNDTLKSLQTQQNTKAQTKVAVDKSQVERIPEATARNIRKRASESEGKNVRTEGRVTKHDKNDATKYKAQTNDGEVELRALSPNQRPPIDQDITITIPKSDIALPDRADATTTQISTQPQTTPQEATVKPAITAENLAAYLSPTTRAPQPLINTHETQLQPSAAKTTIISPPTPFTLHIEAIINPLLNTLIVDSPAATHPIQPSNIQLASAHSDVQSSITNNFSNLNIISKTNTGNIQTTSTAPTQAPVIGQSLYDISPMSTKNAFLGAKTLTEITAALLTDAKAGQIVAIVTPSSNENNQGQKPTVQILPFNPSTHFSSAYNNELISDTAQSFTLHASKSDFPPSETIITLTPHGSPQHTENAASLPRVAAGTPALSTWGPLLLTPEPWNSLNQLQQTLLQIAPQQATTLTALTPSTQNPTQLIPAALFFLTAIKSGDIQSWLGEKTIEALNKHGKSKLLSRLSNELDAHTRLAKEPSGEWRTHALPLQHNGEFHKITLHTKENPEESADKHSNKKNSTRFIFDLDLDKVGPLQLDGFFHSNGKRLDIILRTQQLFSKAMQIHMKKLYAGALEQSQIYGEITFQNRPDQWVSVTPTAAHKTTKDV